MPITGINNTCSAATHSMDIKFSSKDNKYSNTVICFILPNVTGNMPSSIIDITTLKLPKGITLADEEFNIPGRIDMLIGSDLYPYLMKGGRRTFGKNHPVLQETHLGWILLGRIPKEGADRSTTLFMCNEPSIDFKLQRFWKQEEIVAPVHTKEEEAVERHFVETTTRDETAFHSETSTSFTKFSTWKYLHHSTVQVPTIGKKADKKFGALKGVYEVHG